MSLEKLDRIAKIAKIVTIVSFSIVMVLVFYRSITVYISLEVQEAIEEKTFLLEDVNRKLDLLDEKMRELNQLKEELKNEGRKICR